MICNEVGIAIIKAFESFRPLPYLCPSKIPTIGYGTTRYPGGKTVSLSDYGVTEDEAVAFLRHDVKSAEECIRRNVKAPLTENQFSALASLIYNIGSGNFQASTLRMKLNRLDYFGASNEFPKWRRSRGVVLRGLVRRRAMERSLFLC